MRYFVEMAYDGTNYHGWQIQPNAVSVQEELMKALRMLTRDETIVPMGAGRTDTGVHADYFVAHFDSEWQMEDADSAVFKLNSILPGDISVFSVQAVDEKMHSRFAATERTYHYRLTMVKDTLARTYTFRPFFPLDFEAMNQAAKMLLDVEDFTSFSKTGTQVKTNICHVRKAEWFEQSAGRYTFEISADRFLRNMVRAIVGTLFEVGKGRMSLSQMEEVVRTKDRRAAGMSVSAAGLSLVDIKYPEGRGFVPTVVRPTIR